MKKTTKRALSLPVLGAAVVGASSLLGAPSASASTTAGPGGSASGAVSSVVSGTVSGAVSGTGAQAPAQAPARAASGSAAGHAAATRAAADPGGGLGSNQPQVAHNAGLAGSYFLDHLQYEHLDQPYLGFGPTVQNPGYWLSNHIIPVFINTGSLALTGDYYTSSMDDSGSGGAASSQVPQVAHNAGLGGSYFLDHLQYEHLDQPELGFGPALQNPGYWFTNHLVPVFLTTASLTLTGDGADGGM